MYFIPLFISSKKYSCLNILLAKGFVIEQKV
jgi:hypothetical protein